MKEVITLIIGFILIFSFLVFQTIKSRKNNEYFIKSSINSNIYRIHNVQDKFFKYFYEQEKYLKSYKVLPVIELKIGDSISKKSNTGKFRIYRKTSSGIYHLIREYEYKPDYSPWSYNNE